jgi:predicted enzyme related to lactoylglutathione lyase
MKLRTASLGIQTVFLMIAIGSTVPAAEPPMAEGVFVWHQLTTRSPDKAKEFYSTVFGWTAENAPVGEFKKHMLFKKDGREIAGMQPAAEGGREGTPEHWLTFILVEDAAKTVKEAKKLGGKVRTPITELPFGCFAVLQDPTNAVFAIFQLTEDDNAENSPEPVFVWHELMTRDADKALKFYVQLFGWTGKVETYEEMKTEYGMFLRGNEMVGGILPMTGPQFEGIPANWTVYYGVEDIEKTIAKAEEAGGQVYKPITSIPAGKFAVIGDTNGASVALFEEKAKD